LLEEEEQELRDADNTESPGEGWEGWEIASDDDHEDGSKSIKKKASSKPVSVVVINEDGNEQEGVDGEDDGWEDEDAEDEESGNFFIL
jgi:hypothetical protein